MADERIVTSIVANSDFSNLIADVQRVTTSLFKLQQEFAGANRALAGQMDAANAMFNQNMLKTGQFSSHFVSLTSDVEKFGKNLDGGRLKLKDYFRVYQENVRTSGGLIRDLAKQQVQLQNAVLQPLGKNAQGLMQYNVHIPRGLDLTKNKTSLLKQELQIMNKVIQDGGVQLINWGKNTQWAGRQLTVGLTLPLVAFGKAAADAFKVADQELTRLTKVYGDVAGTSAQELSKVRKEVSATAKDLASAMGVNFSETISLAADIAATGKTGNELLSSVSETTRLAVLGEVDRQEAMKATLAIQSAFKSNTEELAETINFLNAVENQTSTTLNDLVEAIPKAGPVIKGLGGDVQDLALYMTAMREGGINASEGANALKSALASLINPTDVAVKKFQGFGIDLLGIVSKNAGDVTSTLFALQGALDKLDPLSKQQAIEQLFGKFQFSRLNALFENLGRQGSQTLQVLDLMKASAGELEAVAGRELAAVTESAAGRYKRAVETLKAELASTGDQFLNVATKLVNALNKILEFGSKLPDPIKKLLTFAGAFTAIIGPVIMLTGVLANFFGYIIKGLGHFKALFKGAEGFKLLTPEIIAARNASSMLSDEFYSDAKAADTLSLAIKRLNEDLKGLQLNAANATSTTNSLGATISTAAGTPIMTVGSLGSQRITDPKHPLVGPQTRAAAHLNPRDPNNPSSIFGLTLQPVPVNRKIGPTPQILMSERLPDVPGLTTMSGVSTGVVAAEHAKFAALMATLGVQSQQEIDALKKTIGLGGQVSRELLDTFDDILPITQRLTANAAAQSTSIVAELRAGTINIQQARAQIIAVNAQLEALMGAEVSAYAASRGRTIDLTRAPLINQPVVDAAGKPNIRGAYRGGIFLEVMESLGRATGTKSFGGPYSIETTRPIQRNRGGSIPGYINGEYVYMTNGETVPGPNVNADVVPAMLTPGEFVLTRDVVEQQGPDAVEALHRGQAAIVPFGANMGGKVPGYRFGKFVRQPASSRSATSSRTRDIAISGEYGNYSWQTRNSRVGSQIDEYISSLLNPADKEKAALIIQNFANRITTSPNNPLGRARYPGVIQPSHIAKEEIGLSAILQSSGLPALIQNVKTHQTHLTRASVAAGKRYVSRYVVDFDELSNLQANAGTLRVVDFIARNIGRKNKYNTLFKQSGVPKEKWDFAENEIDDALSKMLSGKSDKFIGDNVGDLIFEKDFVPIIDQIMINNGASPSQISMIKRNTILRRNRGGSIPGYINGGGIQKITKFSALQRIREYVENAAKSKFGAKPVSYSHITPSGGKSLDVPGGIGYAVNAQGQRVHVKMLPNDDAFAAEDIGAYMSRKMGLVSPRPTLVKTPNPLDPSGKESILAAETLFDPRLIAGATNKASQNTMDSIIRQLVLSSILGDIDMSPANAQGYLRPDIGPGGITSKASGLRRFDPTLRSVSLTARANAGMEKIGAKSAFGNSVGAMIKAYGAKRAATKARKVLKDADLETTMERFFIGNPQYAPYKDTIMKRISDADGVDWETVFTSHSKMTPKLRKGGAVRGYNRGGAVRGGTNPQYGYARGVQKRNLGGYLLKFLAAMGVSQLGTSAGQKMGGGGGQALTMASQFLPFMFMGMPGMGGPKPTAQQRLGMASPIGSATGYGPTLASQMNLMPSAPLGAMRQSVFATSTPILGRFAGSVEKASSSSSKLVSIFGKLGLAATRFNAILAVSVIAGMKLFDAYKDAKRSAELFSNSFGLTEAAAKKAGLQYTDYKKTLKDAIDAQQLFINQNKLTYESMTSANTPFRMTIAEYKKLRKEVKGTMSDQIETLTNAANTDVNRLVVQLKEQLVAAGLSAEEASKRIYAMLQLSNKSALTSSAMSSDRFRNIKDPSSAALSALETFGFARDANPKTGKFDSEFNSFNTAMTAIDNAVQNSYEKSQKLAEKKKKDFDETLGLYEAEKRQLDIINSKMSNQKEIGEEFLYILQEQNPELAKFLNSQDTIVSTWQKIRLATRGYTGDLERLNATQTALAYQLSTEISKAVQIENQNGLLKDQYKEYNRLKDVQKSLLAAAKGQSVQEQINARDAIRAIDKKIKKINEEADARKKALQEEAQAEDLALKVKEARLEYERRVSAGDLDGAAEAYLGLQRVLNEQETFLTEKAIEDKRKKDLAPLEKEKERLEKEQERLADKAALAADSLESINNKLLKQKTKIDNVNDAMSSLRLAVELNEKDLERFKTTDQFKGLVANFINAARGVGVTVPSDSSVNYTKEGGLVVGNNAFGDAALNLLDKSLPNLTTILAQKDINITGTDIIIDGKSLNLGTGTSANPFFAGDASKFINPIDLSGYNSTYGSNSVRELVKQVAENKGYERGQFFEMEDEKGNIYKFKVRPDGNITMVTNPLKKFDGGPIHGAGTATSDSIPAYLSDGEYVMRAAAVDHYGVDTMDAINAKKLKHGGRVGGPYQSRWGELVRDIHGLAYGRDIWGGTEIPGLKFRGKRPNHSDYLHQMQEQPPKPFKGSGGTYLPIEMMSLLGSVPLEGLYGGGLGFGGMLTMANGGMVKGYALGGLFRKAIKAITSKVNFSGIKGGLDRSVKSLMDSLGMTKPDNQFDAYPFEGQLAKESLEKAIDNVSRHIAILPQIPMDYMQAKLLQKEYNSLARQLKKNANIYKNSTRTVGEHNATAPRTINYDKDGNVIPNNIKQIDYNPIVKSFDDFIENVKASDFSNEISPIDKDFFNIVNNPEVGVPGSGILFSRSGFNAPDLFGQLDAPETLSMYDYYLGLAAENKIIMSVYRDIAKIVATDPKLAKRLGYIEGYSYGGIVSKFHKGGKAGHKHSILSKIDSALGGLADKKNWEKTSDLFSLPSIGKTFQDIAEYGTPVNAIFARLAGKEMKSSIGDNAITAATFFPYAKIPGLQKLGTKLKSGFSNFGVNADQKIASIFEKISGGGKGGSPALPPAVLPEPLKLSKIHPDFIRAHPQEKVFLRYLLDRGVSPEEAARQLMIRRGGVDYRPRKITHASIWDDVTPSQTAADQAQLAAEQAAFEDAMLLFPFARGEKQFDKFLPQSIIPRNPSPAKGFYQDSGKPGEDVDLKIDILKKAGVSGDYETLVNYILARQNPTFFGIPTRESIYESINKLNVDQALAQQISEIVSKKGLLDTSIFKPLTKVGEDGKVSLLRPDIGVHSALMRILRDPETSRIFYEKGSTPELPVKTAYMEIFSELYGAKLAKYLGIPSPENSLGFRAGDILSPVILSEDFKKRGFETVLDRFSTGATKDLYGTGDLSKHGYILPDADILRTKLAEDLGRLSGFSSMIQSKDTIVNDSNLMMSKVGARLGALDFGFAWDKDAPFPDMFSKTSETLRLLKEPFERLLNRASFGKISAEQFPDEQFLTNVYRGFSDVSGRMGNLTNIKKIMSLVLNQMTDARPNLDLRLPLEMAEQMQSLEEIFKRFAAGKFAGGGYVNTSSGYVNPSYSSNMSMPSYYTGAKYVYDDTIAELHKGEMVVPSGMNPNNPFEMSSTGGGTYYIQPTINAAPGMDEMALARMATDMTLRALENTKVKSGTERNITRRYQ